MRKRHLPAEIGCRKRLFPQFTFERRKSIPVNPVSNEKNGFICNEKALRRVILTEVKKQ